jgi:hypothetical protein
MAETPVAPNNKAVAFSGKKEREPAGLTNTAPMKMASTPKKLSPRGRKKVKSAIKRGMISEKAAKRHFGEDA